jgi:DNA polymerase-3 subunit alpha
VTSLVKKITWLLHPEHPELPAFLQRLRATVGASSGDTRLAFAFVFGDRTAAVADVPSSLGWKLDPPTFRELRDHPGVAGALIETKRLQLKESRRWTRSR